MTNTTSNLNFIVSLLDRVSGPAKRMANNMDAITTRLQSGYRKIGYGAGGLVGTGLALDSLLTPTKDMQQALGEVSSLDVAQETLDSLRNTALKFSVQYGQSSVDFVRASYDIKGAIDGLVGDELPAFTNASAILAKGTKADTADITSYVGTMYGIFKDVADNMGKSAWVEQLAGQTALAVKIFKTDGRGISQAFTTLGAEAAAANVPVQEQMSVLGKLLATMPGGDAGTKYRAFLHGVGKAQDELGLNFSDASGHMLPIVQILEKIKNKYGDLGKVATSDILKKAFGTDEALALVKLLSIDIDGLNESIKDIGNQKGMQNAIDMAKKMTMPWDRASKGIEAVKIALGTLLLPEITKFFDKINYGIEKMMRWTELFPDLSRFISLGTLAIFGLIAGVSILSITMGVATLAAGGFAAVMAFITSPITLVVAALVGLTYYFRHEIPGAIDYVMAKFTELKQWFHHFNLWESLLSGVDLLIEKINSIPGVHIDTGSIPMPMSAPITSSNTGNNGGLLQKISNQNNTKSRTIGDVTINNYESKKSLSQLVDEIQMAGG